MVASQTLRELWAGREDLRIVAPSAATGEDSFLVAVEDSTSIDAELIEDEDFRAHDVDLTGETGFTHFLDGAQKALACGYFGLSPIILAHTSACIVRREERDVLPPIDSCYSGSTEIFAPLDVAVPAPAGIEVRPVRVREAQNGYAAAQEVRNAVSARREARETEVALGFTEGRLLVDGGIGRIQGRNSFLIGMVKSHQRQYFQSQQRIDVIVRLEVGQRTTVFRREGGTKQGQEAYSFYLRLHASQNQGPMFGLVRIEMPHREEFLAQVDDIASWVLHERSPLSLPDPRYDRMLYPVRLVEKHLKSRQPSDAALRAIIGL